MSAAGAAAAFIFIVVLGIAYYYYRKNRQASQSSVLPVYTPAPLPYVPPQPSPFPAQYVSTHFLSFSKSFLHGEHPDLGHESLPALRHQS